jgi:hypothetical protein
MSASPLNDTDNSSGSQLKQSLKQTRINLTNSQVLNTELDDDKLDTAKITVEFGEN